MDQNDLYLEWQRMSEAERKATGYKSVEAYVLGRLGDYTQSLLDWGD